MSHSGPQINQLLKRAADAADSVAADPEANVTSAELRAPEGTVCAVCDGPLLARQSARRGPTGLRHESCP